MIGLRIGRGVGKIPFQNKFLFQRTFVTKMTEEAHFYNFTVNDIDGQSVKLEEYRGNVVVVVNVASK